MPALKTIRILPGSRVQLEPGRWQQLSVQAEFADGSVRDVTRLTVFSSSDPGVADVDSAGLVSFRQPGETAILCRYLMELQTVRLTYLKPRPDFVWTNPPEMSSFSIISTVEMILGSVAGRKPTKGIISRLASSSVEP